MVVIRLSRGGSKGRPFFNIVVADKRVRRDGRFIERIGFYNPTAKENEEGLRIVQDRLTYWKSVGAQSSPTVDRLSGFRWLARRNPPFSFLHEVHHGRTPDARTRRTPCRCC